jgi:hypothetical protein
MRPPLITLLTPNENGNAHSGAKGTAEQRSARSRSNDRRDQPADDYGDLGITDQDVPF